MRLLGFIPYVNSTEEDKDAVALKKRRASFIEWANFTLIDLETVKHTSSRVYLLVDHRIIKTV